MSNVKSQFGSSKTKDVVPNWAAKTGVDTGPSVLIFDLSNLEKKMYTETFAQW